MMHFKNLFFFCAASAIVSLEVGCTPEPVVTPPIAPVNNNTCDLATMKQDNMTFASFTYDAQHRIATTQGIFSNGTITNMVYNSNGVISEWDVKDTMGVILDKTVYTYNSANKLVRSEQFGPSGQSRGNVSTYEYDANMRKIRENQLEADTVKYYTAFEYTGSSDLPSVITLHSKSNGTDNIYNYSAMVYDANKNILSKTDDLNATQKRKKTFYTYDDKKQGFVIKYPGLGGISAFNAYGLSGIGGNNVLSIREENYNSAGAVTTTTTNSFTYEYDANGYPTKRTYVSPSSGSTSVITFTYHCH